MRLTLSLAVTLLVVGEARAQSVEIEVERLERLPSLRRALIHRALEEGFSVVRARGQIRLVVVGVPEGVEIVAQGTEAHRALVDPGPPELVELEVLQRAAWLLKELSGPPASASPRATIAVGSEAEDARFERILEDLVLADVGVSPRAHSGDKVPRLCVTRRGDRIELGVARPDQSCEAAPRLELSAEPSDQELADASAQLRAWARASQSPESRDAGVSQTTLDDRARPYRHVAVEFGAVARGSTVEPELRMSLVWMLGSTLGIEVGSTSVGTVDEQISTLDVDLTLGPAWRVPLGSSVNLTAAAALGGAVHIFNVPGYDSGAHWDYALAVPLTLGWSASRPVGIVFTALGEFRGRRREHVLEGQGTIWQREAWSASLLAGASVWP